MTTRGCCRGRSAVTAFNKTMQACGYRSWIALAQCAIAHFSSASSNNRYAIAFPRRDAPEVCSSSHPPKDEGAGKTGCRPAPMAPVLNIAQAMHRGKTTGEAGNNPAFPAQWVDGLWRALPGDEFVLPPSPRGNWRCIDVRSARCIFRESLTPATGAGTTRFCRTRRRRSSCAPHFAHGSRHLREHRPATALRADADASTASPTRVS
jgi:hypothetical protein